MKLKLSLLAKGAALEIRMLIVALPLVKETGSVVVRVEGRLMGLERSGGRPSVLGARVRL